MPPDWVPEQHGFQVKDVDHIDCTDEKACLEYKEVRYPPLDNSLRLRAYAWPIKDREDGAKWDDCNGCTVLEGTQ